MQVCPHLHTVGSRTTKFFSAGLSNYDPFLSGKHIWTNAKHAKEQRQFPVMRSNLIKLNFPSATSY